MKRRGKTTSSFFKRGRAASRDGSPTARAGTWARGGRLRATFSAWSSNSRNGRDMDLYVAAPADPNFVRRFKEVSGQWTVADWSRDETKVVAVEYVSINESYIHMIEVATGKTGLSPHPRDGKSGPVSFSSPRFSKDGRSLYYVSDQSSEFRGLVHHDLGSGQLAFLTQSLPWDVEGFDLSDDGDESPGHERGGP